MKKSCIMLLVCMFLNSACSQKTNILDVNQNLDPTIDPHIEQNIDPNIEQNIDPNLDQNLDPNLSPNIDQDIYQDIDSKENLTSTEQEELPTEGADSTSETNLSMSIEFLYQYDYWTLYDNSNAVFKTKEEYEKELRSYITDIEKLLHKETWLDNYDTQYNTLYIKLKILDQSIGTITPPAVYTTDSLIAYLIVGEDLFLNKFNPIIHELTHLISYNPKLDRLGLSISLNDGLAEYVNKQIGGEDSYFIKNIPIHDYLTQYLPVVYQFDINQDEAKEFINELATDELTYRYEAFSKDWMYFFMCNVSFVEYVIEEHGIDFFMNLHDYHEEDNIKKQQEQLNDLKIEWIEYLNNYPYQMTYDEINTVLKGN